MEQQTWSPQKALRKKARARATRVGGTMRVSYNSSTPDRQSGDLGAAPSTRSTYTTWSGDQRKLQISASGDRHLGVVNIRVHSQNVHFLYRIFPFQFICGFAIMVVNSSFNIGCDI